LIFLGDCHCHHLLPVNVIAIVIVDAVLSSVIVSLSPLPSLKNRHCHSNIVVVVAKSLLSPSSFCCRCFRLLRNIVAIVVLSASSFLDHRCHHLCPSLPHFLTVAAIFALRPSSLFCRRCCRHCHLHSIIVSAALLLIHASVRWCFGDVCHCSCSLVDCSIFIL